LTYLHNEHGSYVYFSVEQTLIGNMIWWMMPLFLLCFLIAPRKEYPKSLGMRFLNDDPFNVVVWTGYPTIVMVWVMAWVFWPQIIAWLLAHGLTPIGDAPPVP